MAFESVKGEKAIEFRIIKGYPGESDTLQSFLCSQKESQYIFKPYYTYQTFKEDSYINGYKDLELRIYIHNPTFLAYLEYSYSLKDKDATDFISMLKVDAFRGELYTDQSQFLAALKKEKEEFRKMQCCEIIKYIPEQAIYKSSDTFIFTLDAHQKRFPFLQVLHKRLQNLTLFFIEGASFIDYDDENGSFQLIISFTNVNGQEYLAGFCTIYKFKKFPEILRLRLCQILVLPPFQKQGIGSKMMDFVYKQSHIQNALDVTFEDPSDDLQISRHKYELKSCWQIPTISQQVLKTLKEVCIEFKKLKRSQPLPQPNKKLTYGELLEQKAKLNKNINKINSNCINSSCNTFDDKQNNGKQDGIQCQNMDHLNNSNTNNSYGLIVESGQQLQDLLQQWGDRDNNKNLTQSTLDDQIKTNNQIHFVDNTLLPDKVEGKQSVKAAHLVQQSKVENNNLQQQQLQQVNSQSNYTLNSNGSSKELSLQNYHNFDGPLQQGHLQQIQKKRKIQPIVKESDDDQLAHKFNSTQKAEMSKRSRSLIAEPPHLGLQEPQQKLKIDALDILYNGPTAKDSSDLNKESHGAFIVSNSNNIFPDTIIQGLIGQLEGKQGPLDQGSTFDAKQNSEQENEEDVQTFKSNDQIIAYVKFYNHFKHIIQQVIFKARIPKSILDIMESQCKIYRSQGLQVWEDLLWTGLHSLQSTKQINDDDFIIVQNIILCLIQFRCQVENQQQGEDDNKIFEDLEGENFVVEKKGKTKAKNQILHPPSQEMEEELMYRSQEIQQICQCMKNE